MDKRRRIWATDSACQQCFPLNTATELQSRFLTALTVGQYSLWEMWPLLYLPLGNCYHRREPTLPEAWPSDYNLSWKWAIEQRQLRGSVSNENQRACLEQEQQQTAQPAWDTTTLYDAALRNPKGNLTFNRCSAFCIVSREEKESEKTNYRKVL